MQQMQLDQGTSSNMPTRTEVREEMQVMFQQFLQQLQETVPAMQPQQNSSQQEEMVPEPDMELHWEALLDELPAAPHLDDSSWPKVFKLAKELERRAALMTAGRDLHDIHTSIIFAAHWAHLQSYARNYIAHRLRLLYIATTKGWPAALFYEPTGYG
jgi:hypothetical protein